MAQHRYRLDFYVHVGSKTMYLHDSDGVIYEVYKLTPVELKLAKIYFPEKR